MYKRPLFYWILAPILLLAVVLFCVPSYAAETVCSGCVQATFNGLPACTLDGRLHLCGNNFPDKSFRSFLTTTYDADRDEFLTVSQVDGLHVMDCRQKHIDSLDGIGFFGNLTELNCSYNTIRRLDLSCNRNLVSLSCQHSSIGTLTLPKENLTYVDCSQNNISRLDLSGAGSLLQLLCNHNLLYELNLSGTNLQMLDCTRNYLAQLDLSGFTRLEILCCKQNNLKSICLTGATAIAHLECQNNFITELDISSLTNLQVLDCRNNEIPALDIRSDRLTYLDCSLNQLTALDLSQITVLETLNAASNRLLRIDLSNCAALKEVKLGTQEASAPITISRNDNTEYLILDLNTTFPQGEIRRITKVEHASYPKPPMHYDPETGLIKLTSPFSSILYSYKPVTASAFLQEEPEMKVILSFAFYCEHAWREATCTRPSTCIYCGEEAGDCLPHNYLPATATEPARCTVCGHKEGHPLDHVWNAATCRTPKYCIYCKKTEGSALPHRYNAPTHCGSKRYCVICGYVLTTQEQHSWEQINCAIQRCAYCGKEAYSARAHAWTIGTPFSPSRCLNCNAKNPVPFGYGYQILFIAVIDFIEFFAAIIYLIDDRRERKY